MPEAAGFVWIPQGSKLGSSLQTSDLLFPMGCQALGLCDKNAAFIHPQGPQGCLSPAARIGYSIGA